MLLTKNKKDFKTILAQNEVERRKVNPLADSPGFSESQNSLSPAGQPVSEIPSFSQEIQATQYLDLKIGDEPQALPPRKGDIKENTPGQNPQVTEQQKGTRRNLSKEQNHFDPHPRPPVGDEQTGKRISNAEQSDNSKAKNPPGREKSGADSDLSKAELQSALAKISSQIEGLMDSKKDEPKQPLPKKAPKETRETIKKLAKSGMKVNNIAKKLGIPSGEVELILNLSDDE